MNIMFVEHGTVVTPPLNDTILPGVVRDSILTIAKDIGIAVREEAYTAERLIAKLKDRSIEEAFACGTAATITGIDQFSTEWNETFRLGAPGPISQKLHRELVAVQYGRAPDNYGWLRSVVPAKSLVSG